MMLKQMFVDMGLSKNGTWRAFGVQYDELGNCVVGSDILQSVRNVRKRDLHSAKMEVLYHLHKYVQDVVFRVDKESEEEYEND